MENFLGPDPKSRYPIQGYASMIFLKNWIQAPNIHVGDYTYFDDRRYGPEKFEENNVLYNYHLNEVKLVIGKFCAIAAETKLMMTGNHKLDSISTYPFPIFQQGWEAAFATSDFPLRGDLVIGNDVWLGYDSLVLSGVQIGHGSIIGARAVVAKDVPPYSVVVGNPGRVIKRRFSEDKIERLLKLAWWDWDIEKITRHLKLICSCDLDLLERAAAS